MVNPINPIALLWNGQKPSLRLRGLWTTPPSALMASGNSTKTGPMSELEFRFFRISIFFLGYHQLADRPKKPLLPCLCPLVLPGGLVTVTLGGCWRSDVFLPPKMGSEVWWDRKRSSGIYNNPIVGWIYRYRIINLWLDNMGYTTIDMYNNHRSIYIYSWTYPNR